MKALLETSLTTITNQVSFLTQRLCTCLWQTRCLRRKLFRSTGSALEQPIKESRWASVALVTTWVLYSWSHFKTSTVLTFPTLKPTSWVFKHLKQEMQWWKFFQGTCIVLICFFALNQHNHRYSLCYCWAYFKETPARTPIQSKYSPGHK